MSVQKTVRLKKWWKPKASNLLTILYVVMTITALPFEPAMILLLPSVATILGIGAFGHLVNDLFDISEDRAAGKFNRMAQIGLAQRFVWLVASLFIALFPWLFLPADIYSYLLLAVEFGLLIVYAMPPLRLKRSLVGAILVDGAYAYAVPAVLAAYTFILATSSTSMTNFIAALFVWQLAYGCRHYLDHLAIDRPNDLKSNNRTLATVKGNFAISIYLRQIVLPVEVSIFMLILVLLSSSSWLFALVTLGAFLFYLTIPLLLGIGRSYSMFTYRFSNSQLDGFYQNIWPFVPLGFLVVSDLRFLVFLLMHFVLFSRIITNLLQTIRPLFKIRLQRMNSLFLLAFPVLLFRRFRHMPVPNSKKADDKAVREEIKAKPSVNIAIANINKGKYTETFIDEIVPKLNYHVHYLYGAELPTHDHEGRHFLSNHSFIQKFIAFVEEVSDSKKDHFQQQSIASYLQTNNIKVVLAQFGPVGVQMSAITDKVGIPLIVYFHGYDVFHSGILNQQKENYKQLFLSATSIICVSDQMKASLVDMGADSEKIFHLPAYVDLQLFPYSDHSQFDARFISVGRFTETKSPHLTLLAFSKVVKYFPDATLTMIGKGGGGELFESCVILARALHVSTNVIFKGILTHEEVANEMKQAAIFVQHSVTTPEFNDREGKPVAIMEAMACGLPVVATAHSGITELIEHDKTGLLVDEYDVDGMANAMLLLVRNRTKARDIGLNASRRIHSDSLISNHVSILEGIIQHAIQG